MSDVMPVHDNGGFNLSKLIKSLPKNWKSMGLGKCILFVRNGCSATQGEEGESTIPVTRIETISGGFINIEKVGHVEIRSVDEKFRLLAGDIQFSNINSLSMIGNCALFSAESALYAGMNLLQIRPNMKLVSPSFMHWQMSSSLFRGLVEACAKPAINQASIPSSALRQLPFIVPPLPEQKQIAAFLDYETAKIDALIEKQQQLIALLGEKRQAVISLAVTKGLNPDVPMRDSGVEWLGEVPEHWVVMTVRNMLRAGVLETQDGNHGELHPVAADYVDEGVPFLMANNIRNGCVSLNPCNFLTKEHADSLRIGFARKGDLLLTHKGTVGEVAMVPEALKDYWMLTPQVTYYRWKNPDYSPNYYYYLFQSLAVLEQLRVIGGKQSTRAYVGLVAQKELVLLVPPLAEQNAIVKSLSKLTDDGLDALTSKAVDKISLLKERRSALISAAVTGRIDVRNWKPPTDDKPQKPDKEAA